MQMHEYANAVEKIHANLYQNALKNIDVQKKASFNYYVCPVCGYAAEKEVPIPARSVGQMAKLSRKSSER